ncbi:enoyl-CoA-hydratase DpgB [Streptomyces sp. NPDC048504]|uniref:enoyl-CoA-hydratase DpgB n=1 Tax=Streptomyces sp. NPDC048504 TaxID=3365559 RepID=UPI0037113CFA
MKSTPTAAAHPASEEIPLRIDGRQPLSAHTVAAVTAACEAAEDLDGRASVVVHVSGAPGGPLPDGLTVSLVSKWERVLRRLERLPATTVAVADGDCGGPALDVLLATDHRIATTTVRLVVPVEGGGTWPGMALYRLAGHGTHAAPIRHAVLYGTPVSAADALALHLVDELTDDVPEALRLAADRARAVSGTELAIRRQLLHEAAGTSFEEALGAHLAACDRVLRRATTGAEA